MNQGFDFVYRYFLIDRKSHCIFSGRHAAHQTVCFAGDTFAVHCFFDTGQMFFYLFQICTFFFWYSFH